MQHTLKGRESILSHDICVTSKYLGLLHQDNMVLLSNIWRFCTALWYCFTTLYLLFWHHRVYVVSYFTIFGVSVPRCVVILLDFAFLYHNLCCYCAKFDVLVYDLMSLYHDIYFHIIIRISGWIHMLEFPRFAICNFMIWNECNRMTILNWNY